MASDTTGEIRRIDRVLVLSDLHVGSTVAVMPRGFKTAEGNEIGLNGVQEFLLAAWEDMLRWSAALMEGGNYALVINGDCIDGDHHGTKQIWSKDIGDQIEACVELLKPLTYRAAKVFVVRGTESHTHNTELAIGKALGAERNPETGAAAFDRLHLSVNGTRCVFRHHVGTSTRSWSEATAMASTLAEETIQAARNGEAPRQVVCCAHRHKFGTYSNGRGTVVISPPWQMLSRFGHRVVGEARTQPGAYVLDFSCRPSGALPTVHERIYSAPAEPEIEL